MLGGSGKSSPVSSNSFVALLLMAFIGAAGAVAYFDFGTALPFNDEWFYRWTVHGLAAGRGFHMWPLTPVVSLLQLSLAAIPDALNLPPGFGRLTVLPFLVLQAVYTYRLARLLGAVREWALLAAAVPALSAVELSLATSIMSDVGFLGLLMAASYYTVRVVREEGGVVGCIAFVLLAGLQRQLVVAILPGLAVGFLVTRGRRKVVPSVAILGAVSVAALAAVAIPFVAGFASTTMRAFAGGAGGHLSSKLVTALAYLAPMLGMFLTPFAPALILARRRGWGGWWALLPLAVLALWVLPAALHAIHSPILPGNYWTVGGLGPAQLEGTKVSPYPHLLFVASEAAIVITSLAILAWQTRAWSPSSLGAAGLTLSTIAVVQVLLFMTNYVVYDRHYLSVVAPLSPVVAAFISREERWPAWSRGLAVAILLAGLGAYVLGQQDFEAWQVAREAASRLAYAATQPSMVDAGFEADGTHLILPHFLATGDSSIYPTHPRVRLVNALPGDRRPGVTYGLRRARIVIAPGGTVSPPGESIARDFAGFAPPLIILTLAGLAFSARRRKRNG